MERRNFLKLSTLFGLVPFFGVEKASGADSVMPNGTDDRAYWVSLLDKIATPVLANMSAGTLVKNMPMQVSPSWDNRPKSVGYMEAFGRLLAGIVPFIALPDDTTSEGKVRKRLRDQALRSLANGFDPSNPDYLNWGSPKVRQPLVDASYIAQALLTAPDTLWRPLDETTKSRVIHEFTTIRQLEPANNNWVLFAATIECFLLSIGQPIDEKRIDTAIEKILKWYVGDGWYGDGDHFHFDHYNGYVIHSMLVDVLRTNVAKGRRPQADLDLAVKRMKRYAHHQERMISPEGTFPVVGRSSTYKAGGFWPLARLALENDLPEGITPGQVRCALTAVFKNIFVPETFAKDDWIEIGFRGNKQAAIADPYSNTGSMYITTLPFMPLGLPAAHEFWTAPFTDWTQRKAWSGQPITNDHYVDY